MKFDKQVAIILVLASLLMSALGAAFYFYNQNQKALVSNNKQIEVYVAAKDIKKDAQITAKNIKKVKIAKKYILTTPLLKSEVIGKFAKENIYKNDIFRKEKISAKLSIKKTTIVDKFKYSSYNMAFKMFQNPNYALKKGDYINIISVIPSGMEDPKVSPNIVQYVVKQVKILGFLRNGKESDIVIKKEKITKTVKKKEVTKIVDVKADELILDIDNKTLLSLTDDYNRGRQLWMVKTHPIKAKQQIVKKIKSDIKRTYPTKLYKPRDGKNSYKATIHYGDSKKASVVKNKTFIVSKQGECKNSDNFLVGVSNKVHLRVAPSNKRKIVRIVYKNYLIPYKEKVNDIWYKTCDGYFIHSFEAKPISKELALKKLGK